MSSSGAAGNPSTEARDDVPARAAVAAVDLGATSGRVMLGVVDGGDAGGRIELVDASRFENPLAERDRHLSWDLDTLWARIRDGLCEAHRLARERGLPGLSSIGVASWAVDYVFLGPDGTRIGNAISYRDARTEGVADQVAERVSRERQFAITGIAQQPFNTIYQLAADDRVAGLPAGSQLLLLPDALGFLLTGSRRSERTNASTTGLLDIGGEWSEELLAAVGVERTLFAPFITPGEQLGTVRPELADELGIGQVPVVAVGSHDTASAVLAVPAEQPTGGAGAAPVAYISSGTWSLVGLELDRAIPTEAAREAGFTNEGGVDGTIRFLKNVMGMWLVSESLRQWNEQGAELTLAEVLTAAADEPGSRFLIDATDPVFLPPGAMADRIVEHVRSGSDGTEDARPTTPAQVVRCVLDSLALAYRDAITQACEMAGVALPVRVHVVGGGSQNALLNQLTADALGIEVVAGLVEATALGNVAVQARALSAIGDEVGAIRAAVRASVELEVFTPRGGV